MQKTQEIQAKPLPIASGPFMLTRSASTIGIINPIVSDLFDSHLDQQIAHIVMMISIEPSMLARHILPQVGNHLAIMLAKVLDELEKTNREAIDSIVDIIEPYMDTDREVKVNIRPLSTREITLEITKLGYRTPKIPLSEPET